MTLQELKSYNINDKYFKSNMRRIIKTHQNL